MLMADDGGLTRGELAGGDECGDEDLSIDLDTFFHILGEEPHDVQSTREASSPKYVSQSESAPDASFLENPRCQMGSQVSEGPPPLGAGLKGNSVMVFDCGDIGNSMQAASSASFKDWFSVVPGLESPFAGRAGVPPGEILTHSVALHFAGRDARNLSENGDSLYTSFPNNETKDRFLNVGENVDSK